MEFFESVKFGLRRHIKTRQKDRTEKKCKIYLTLYANLWYNEYIIAYSL